MAEDLSDGIDGLREDMANHQRRFGSGMASDSANHSMAIDAIVRLERERSEQKPLPRPVEVQAPIVETSETREIDGRKYTVETGPDSGSVVRRASPEEHRFLTHALPRIELLMTKMDTGPLGQPSWNQRCLAVFELKSRVPSLIRAGRADLAAQLDVRFVFEMIELLNDSDRLFGPWQADAPTKVSVKSAGVT